MVVPGNSKCGPKHRACSSDSAYRPTPPPRGRQVCPSQRGGTRGFGHRAPNGTPTAQGGIGGFATLPPPLFELFDPEKITPKCHKHTHAKKNLLVRTQHINPKVSLISFASAAADTESSARFSKLLAPRHRVETSGSTLQVETSGSPTLSGSPRG